jgi:hypothetical protein
MRGDIPPLLNTTSWRGAQLKSHRDNFALLLLLLLLLLLKYISNMY